MHKKLKRGYKNIFYYGDVGNRYKIFQSSMLITYSQTEEKIEDLTLNPKKVRRVHMCLQIRTVNETIQRSQLMQPPDHKHSP